MNTNSQYHKPNWPLFSAFYSSILFKTYTYTLYTDYVNIFIMFIERYLMNYTVQNYSGELQINGWFVVCIHIEEAIIWGKEIRVCTHKRDNSVSFVIILVENLVQIGLIIFSRDIDL